MVGCACLRAHGPAMTTTIGLPMLGAPGRTVDSISGRLVAIGVTTSYRMAARAVASDSMSDSMSSPTGWWRRCGGRMALCVVVISMTADPLAFRGLIRCAAIADVLLPAGRR